MTVEKLNRSLINLANIESGLLKNNLVNSPKDLDRFRDISLGIPLLIEADRNVFDFKESDVFKIEAHKILSIIYNHNKSNYVGFKHSFKKLNFLSKFSVNKQNEKNFSLLVKQNNETINYVEKLKQKFKLIGAFQTRNVPHFGHEKIMHEMLKKCDHLVINPIVGPKKKGDVKLEILSKIFHEFLIPKYNGKISFFPILANMFYAGPREAVHHSIIRKKLGFGLFSVGRDHAGASNIYNPLEASKLINKLYSTIGIDVMCHSGTKYCKQCKDIVFEKECRHSKDNFFDISGSKFRESMVQKKYFDLADKKMQSEIFKIYKEIFEND